MSFFVERGSGESKDCPVFQKILNPLSEYDRSKEEEESYRLLYVAMTRAKHNLVACVDGSTKKLSGWEVPLTEALPVVKRQAFEVSMPVVESFDSKVLSVRHPANIRRPQVGSLQPQLESVDLSASVGVLKHQQLTLATKQWTDLLVFLGHSFNVHELNTLVEDPLFQSIFNINYITQCGGLVFDELPILVESGGSNDGGLYRVDRVIVYPERALVVDYKFSHQEDLEQLIATYRTQLERYKKILYAIYKRPVFGYLFDVEGSASRRSGSDCFIHNM